MSAAKVLSELRSLATKDTKAMSTRRGVSVESLLGVTTGNIRKLAKKLGQDDRLANQLWRTDIHEARILAILLAPLAQKTDAELGGWVADINSWDICDHFAKKLSEKIPNVCELVTSWASSEVLYTRRTGLALIANYCMKRQQLEADVSQVFVAVIEQTAADERSHVKQACCWALRELGKMNTDAHEIAIYTALELLESSDRGSVWVGRCAHKELAELVKVPERRRLISGKSKTALKRLVKR